MIAIMMLCLLVASRVQIATSGYFSKKQYDNRILATTKRKKEWVQSRLEPLVVLRTDELKGLATIWHNGIADRFTSFGTLIPGTRPDGDKARLAYEELLKRGESGATLPFARLMEYGVPSDSRMIDKRRALDLYKRHYANLTGLYERYNALEAVERLSTPGMAYQISVMRSKIAGEMAALSRKNRTTTHEARHRVTAGPPGLLARREELNETPLLIAHPLLLVADRREDPQPEGDRQNVHDTTVTKTIAASVERLRNGGGNKSSATFLLDIKAMIDNADIPKDKRDSAILALKSIERNNQLHSVTGMTETELLHLVWDRVHHEDNLENQKALRENLADELSACVENGGTVCSTGRFAHILGTLNGVDNIVDIKPGWALSKELVDKAGTLYRNKVATLDPFDRAALEEANPSQEQEEKSAHIVDEIKTEIRNDFHQTYVNAGVMSQESLDVELNKWIDHIG